MISTLTGRLVFKGLALAEYPLLQVLGSEIEPNTTT
jgi:hypothetical protein